MEFVGFFGLGLVSSLHCLGMCGPIALAHSSRLASLEPPASPRVATFAHLLYNLGRVTTYGFIGGVCGVIGKSLDLSLVALGVGASHRVVGVLAGALVTLFGLMQLGLLRRWEFLSENAFFESALFQKTVARFMEQPWPWAKFIMGVLLGFLPCVLTYSMFVVAISSGGFLSGFLTLVAFGFGTIPTLFLTGVFSGAILRSLRARGNAISGIATLALGAFIFLGALLHDSH
ncbi:MAG: sulfite exporter TauE/SafE family protein [Chloroherpetonaceae bacterium]|nr:sulfite exporter TauE/SafE family protein [Chloroherpetonaceae bacterium]MDW8437494.1 sulfite exporter TauE/SafE family protein [Chloroherpetonaceae bacterium]